MDLKLSDLFYLAQYTIDTIENPRNEVDVNHVLLNELKQELTRTRRVHSSIPQSNNELNKMVSYFKKHKEIVDEVVQKPVIKMDIDFTLRFITSNQKKINEIITQ